MSLLRGHRGRARGRTNRRRRRHHLRGGLEGHSSSDVVPSAEELLMDREDPGHKGGGEVEELAVDVDGRRH